MLLERADEAKVLGTFSLEKARDHRNAQQSAGNSEAL